MYHQFTHASPISDNKAASCLNIIIKDAPKIIGIKYGSFLQRCLNNTDTSSLENSQSRWNYQVMDFIFDLYLVNGIWQSKKFPIRTVLARGKDTSLYLKCSCRLSKVYSSAICIKSKVNQRWTKNMGNPLTGYIHITYTTSLSWFINVILV